MSTLEIQVQNEVNEVQDIQENTEKNVTQEDTLKLDQELLENEANEANEANEVDQNQEYDHEFDIVPLPTDLVVPTDLRFLDKPQATLKQLYTLNVDPKWTEWVRVFDTHRESPDSDETLFLIHYITVSDQEQNKLAMLDIGHVRGVILDSENNIVCQSFGYTPEISGESVDNLDIDVKDYTFQKAYEGTVLRLFFHGHWFVSTHRKIDATMSRWSGPTFGEMFDQLFHNPESELDKNMYYVYILQHKDSQQFFPVEKSRLVHIAFGSGYGFSYCGAYVGEKLTFQNNDEIKSYVDSAFEQRDPTNIGVIAYQNPLFPIKIVSQKYIDIKKIRGNDPKLSTRYIYLMDNPDLQKKLVLNFASDEYAKIDRKMEKLAKEIHKGYIVKFVKKGKRVYPKEQHVVMMRCHSWYNEDRANRMVKFDTVMNMLKTTPGNYLNTMLKLVD